MSNNPPNALNGEIEEFLKSDQGSAVLLELLSSESSRAKITSALKSESARREMFDAMGSEFGRTKILEALGSVDAGTKLKSVIESDTVSHAIEARLKSKYMMLPAYGVVAACILVIAASIFSSSYVAGKKIGEDVAQRALKAALENAEKDTEKVSAVRSESEQVLAQIKSNLEKSAGMEERLLKIERNAVTPDRTILLRLASEVPTRPDPVIGWTNNQEMNLGHHFGIFTKSNPVAPNTEWRIEFSPPKQ